MSQNARPRAAPAPLLGRNRWLRGGGTFPGPVRGGFGLSQRLARRRRRSERGLAPRPGPAGSAGNRAPAAASRGQAQPRSRRDSKLMRGKPRPFCVTAVIALPSLPQGCPGRPLRRGMLAGLIWGCAPCRLPLTPAVSSALMGETSSEGCRSASPVPQREQGIAPLSSRVLPWPSPPSPIC